MYFPGDLNKTVKYNYSLSDIYENDKKKHINDCLLDFSMSYDSLTLKFLELYYRNSLLLSYDSLILPFLNMIGFLYQCYIVSP